MAALPEPRLLLITDRAQATGDLGDVVGKACAGGCRWVSLREKDLPAAEQVALLAWLRAVVKPFRARLTLHGDSALAAAAGADGVHLPDGGDPAQARAVLGPHALIGQSVHTVEDARAADPALLDYITASPVFLTSSKPGYGPALGLAGLAAFTLAARCPVVALGGIGPAEVGSCLKFGAAGVAVMGGVMRAGDPEAEARRLLEACQDARPAYRSVGPRGP